MLCREVLERMTGSLVVSLIDNSNQGTDAKKQDVKDKSKMTILVRVLCVIFFILNILLIIVLVLEHRSTQYSCPDDWIGFQNNCYYFSKEERDWTSSRHNCTTQQADLTMIDTMEEMNFLRRYKCTSDHWIGLEMTENKSGRWVNGTIFKKWFLVRGNEKCAYLDDDGAATARCYAERKWICRRKMH
ncbi:C-type lectin domain family 2 member B isoform X2 [Canis lupus baileyi]|uniref:C-type lectin domain family 2 member B n=1 Tax=Canis lupus familiaris TaxID=9615 RepID=A0A8C0SKD3_CANLF|nr:C-type lectin domain family 2 member B isoform X2 [Canis lupus familiaris]|eukprot:XP_013963826.1 C-type lectin domain family 2 member B isoform X2 [Canis lupus familiaris]